jgi:hypothetical protein
VRSSGVPVDVVECQKHENRARSIPAKDLRLTGELLSVLCNLRVSMDGVRTNRLSIAEGARGEVIFAWKRRSQRFSQA